MEQLTIQTVYQNNLDLERFSLMLDNNSQCYKFFWLEALVNLLVKKGRKEISFFEAAEEMIIQAWYTISEYHLHMGSIYNGESKNAIERAVYYLQDHSSLSSNAAEDKIRKAVSIAEKDPDFIKILLQMTNDVPYRLLSPFVPELKGNDRIWHYDKKMIEYLNLVNNKVLLPYTMRYVSHTDKTIIWNDQWIELIKDNYLLILEWIRSKKIRYLQDRNPGVPGIVYKLDPEGKRKLQNVHKLWDAVMNQETVTDIYSDAILNGSRYDIDHFIPWSYVTTDELWNLTPAEKSTNTSKSNHLPDWNAYFEGFLNNQLMLCDNIQKYEQIRNLFEKCRNNNLNTLWAANLYESKTHDQFRQLMNENMRPIYYSAKLQGYRLWTLEKR